MRRPSTDFIVAESHYLGAGASSPLEVCSSLEQAVRRDLRYHFTGQLCAAYWMDLCRCREYGHQRLVGAVEYILPALVDALTDHLTADRRLDLVSLGPGDGEIDLCLLGRLRETLEVTSYRGIDFSFELLEQVVRRLRTSGVANGLPVMAVCADFGNLDGSAVRSENPCLLLLTGYTIGNNSEERVLAGIASWMKPGDLLLVDGRLQGNTDRDEEPGRGQVEKLVRCYDHPASNRFAFGPVEMFTTATFGSAAFDYRVDQCLTTVPRALNIVIGCAGLEACMRLTGQDVSREHIDLGSTTVYEFESLRSWLAASPLNLLCSWRHDDTGIFLLEKPRRRTAGARRRSRCAPVGPDKDPPAADSATEAGRAANRRVDLLQTDE